ncbi:MAG: hypothetical protein GOV01_01515, partial [Candidatus Altiarchaeota archaeon]|nr:hypothetical protein [Candidatus Altiarchaeota archaeon]
MKWLVPILMLFSVYAVSLDYDSLYTAPAELQNKGYVYLDFCSRSNEARTFQFTSPDFSMSPNRVTVDFLGTSTVPDCKQIVIMVSSDVPGLYTLDAESGVDDWSIPVEFSKIEPITVGLSQSVLYTGYDTVDL